MKSLYIVDGQTAVRQMLAEILNESEYKVLGESGNGLEATEQIQKLKPQVVVVDINLPGLSGTEFLRRISRSNSGIRIVLFSTEYSTASVREALKAGAHGIVEKTIELSELRTAIEVVGNGGSYFGPNIITVLRSVISNPQNTENPSESLTSREQEILPLIALGYSTKKIASTLGLSFKTVENHRTSMMRKLDLHNVADITRYAIQNRLIEVNFVD